jgi:hypothetical protein
VFKLSSKSRSRFHHDVVDFTEKSREAELFRIEDLIVDMNYNYETSVHDSTYTSLRKSEYGYMSIAIYHWWNMRV